LRYPCIIELESIRISSTCSAGCTIFSRLLWTAFLAYTITKKKNYGGESDCVTFSTISLLTNCVTNDCPPLSKNNRIHCVKAFVKKRGAARLPKEGAEDGISAFMTSLTWKNAAPFVRDTPRQSLIYY